MDKRTLETQASACVVLFNRLKTLLSEDAPHEKAALISALDDQHGRFNIWAGNIGVFAAGHASLDHRLREEHQPKLLVKGLLDGLQDHLQRATYIHQSAYGASDDHEEDPAEASGYFDDTTSVSSHSVSSAAPQSYYSASASDLDSESDTKSETLPPFEERLRSVEQVVDRLFRFTTAIRKPSQATQNLKADIRVIKDEAGNDFSPNFGLFARSFVKHRFPDADAALLDRISKAMLLRRRRFIFRRRHQSKLGSKGLTPTVSKIIPLWGASQVSRNTLVPAAQPASSTVSKLTVKPDRSTISGTTASAFPRAFRADSVLAPSTKAPSTVFAGPHTDAVQVPPPPKLLPSSKEFECPYCCMILPVKESTPTRWRVHVLQDLECYVCVFDNCSRADHLFSNRESWISHMEWEHARQWHCTMHGKSPEVFEAETDFVDHMNLDHPGTFTDVQVSQLRHMNARPSQNIFLACPLCGLEPPKELLEGLESPHDSDYTTRQRKSKAASTFVANHLAAHLQEVAVRSLPWSEDVEDDASSVRTASRNGRGSTIDHDDDQSPLDFEDEGPNLTPDDESDLAQVEGEKSLEWGFIPKVEYEGHDNDKRLQAFVQVFYMSDASTDRSEVRFPCHLMPFGRNRSFFGRTKELTEIENALCASRPEEGPEEYSLLKTFAITGAGGMGKSQLATEFVCNNKRLFDAVFWVHADEQSKLSEDFSSIALALGLVGQDSPEAKDHVLTRERVKMWLAHPLKAQPTKNRRETRRDSNDEGPLASWLLVYDGADRPELLNVFWPLGGSGSILITSRDPLPWTASLGLKPFSPEDGAGFLLKMTKRGASKEDEEDAITISKRFGGLPLALTQMARFITNSDLTFSDFIRAYNEREKKEAMFKFQVDGLTTKANYGHNLASVWALENLKEGKALLDVISMLDPDSIPEHILTSFADTVNLKEYPKSIKAYSVARTELIQSSIVGGNARMQTLFIHRLVQDVARLRMSRSQYRETFDAAVRLISSVWPYQPFTWRHSISRWSKCADLYPHIIRLRELSKPFAPDPDNVAGDFEYAKLLMDAGWYQHERGGSSEAEGFYDTAQYICESIKGLLPKPTTDIEEPTQCELAFIQAELTTGNKALAASSPTPQPSATPHTVTFAEPLSRFETNEIPLCEQIFLVHRSPDTDSGATSSSLLTRVRSNSANMPQVLAPRAGGRNVISEQEVDAVLAELHHNRGCIATETNCPKDALRHHSLFNTMMIQDFEGRPPGIDWRLGISWNQLGTAKMINELWEEGEDCFRSAILAMHKVDNFKQVWISLPVVNLGQAYWLTNRCERALIILTEGLSYRQAHFGMDDKESFITGRFFHAIGNVKATQGHMEESLEFHRKALLHYKNTLGNNHHRTADICIKVAEHCIRKDQIDTALTLLDQALRAYGDREAYKPEKARAHFKRAKTLRLLGRKNEAAEELQTSWTLYQEIRPKDTRPVEELIDEDFDKTVVFWSR
ncbi:hypothetical protein BU16DRAFT_612008 [Lophium mytilinum]|uniref:NB-ARC domain-containing protein n=1 Tax=Lophium mytilinum TaxID=390894 RepID=A0A6A6RCQ2_9PEZI|nr:hypothetical protein BU16DRAFT_612008 [Lophium mytilinum]